MFLCRAARPTMLAAIVAAGGCGSDRGPVTDVLDGVSGVSYALVSIEGRPLPAPFAQNRALDDRVQAGTLTLGADGRGAWALRIVEAATGRVRQESSRFEYARDGERVTVSLECPPLASCIAPPHLFGRLGGTRLVVDSSRVTRAPLVFERAP